MTGEIGTAIHEAWNAVLESFGTIVNPDWGALVLPIPLAEGPRPLELTPAAPIPPAGLPISLRAGLVYPPGTVRTDDGEDLAVICPMCRVERSAQLPTCGNCGLVLTVKQGMAVARPAGPPPGGAAAA